MHKTPKALFICSSTQHVVLYSLILEKLKGWNYIFYINTIEPTVMSKISLEHDLNYEYISNVDETTFLKILTKENPNILITNHDQSPVAKLFIKTANMLSIPSLMVQDGLYNFNFKKEVYLRKRIYNRLKFVLHLPFRLLQFLFIDSSISLNHKIATMKFELRYGAKGKRYIYGTGDSTKIAVFGKSTKEFLVSIGVNPDKIIITGSPKFDPLYLMKSKNPINNNKSKKKVLLLTQPFVEAGIWTPNQRENFIVSIFESVKNISDVDLIIKLHPFENKKDYDKILKNSYKNVQIVKDFPLHEILDSSDLSITVSSTTGLEAMVLKKPLIIINLFEDPVSPLFKNENIVHVTNKEDIEETIKTFLYDSYKINELLKSYNHLYYHTYKLDGNASNRIASLMNEMINDL